MNKTTYLDFEQPILDIDEKIAGLQAQSEAENLDMSDEINALKDKRQKTESDIFTNLTRWQKYQLARHPQRPYSLDYI